MKTIVVETKKVVSHDGKGMPVIETIKQKINPELTFNKFVRFLPNQGYAEVNVLEVIETKFETKEEDGRKFQVPKHSKLNEVEKYQARINEVLKPEAKPGDAIDYKAKSEKQEAQLKEMMARLQALEEKNKPVDISEYRLKLETKAKELEITFRSNIGDEKLLEKIKEVQPDFEV
jgi:hypothetical protein